MKFIQDPNQLVPIQQKLFTNELDNNPNSLANQVLPPIYRDEKGFRKVLAAAITEGRAGLDFEFHERRNKQGQITYSPTIIGVASELSSASFRYSDTLANEVIKANIPLSGHAVTDSDRVVMDQALGITTPLTQWSDTYLKFYLCHSDFAATPGKTEDADDSAVLGLFGLWTATSMYTDLYAYKDCRGVYCQGPCPRCDVWGYNAIDAWAGLKVDLALAKEMKLKGIPHSLYLRLQRLSAYCASMTELGIKVDRPYLAQLEDEFEEYKKSLFPYELDKKKNREYGHWKEGEEDTWIGGDFNPRSTKEITTYFDKAGIYLRNKQGKESSDKDTVFKVLDKTIKTLNLPAKFNPELVCLTDLDGEEFDFALVPDEKRIVFQTLVKLAQDKLAGKDLKSWFDAKYIDKQDFIHPRFVLTGTSFGRLSSSNPNSQNIKKVGWGKKLRRALIARAANLALYEADYAQMESRIVLWYAGVRTPIEGDAFVWLVENSNGAFKDAALMLGRNERYVAKSVSHGGNYGESLVVLYEDDLRKQRKQNEIKEGALLVFDGSNGRDLWEYCGGYVGYSGVNLAERLFGNKSNASRAKALLIQEAYFGRFKAIREWHRSLTREAERQGYIQSQSGRYIKLFGTPEENLKTAAAMKGQGGGADLMQEAMLRFADKGDIMNIQIHDAAVFERPLNMTQTETLNFFSPMCEESEIFEGLRCPVEITKGPNFGERETVFKGLC